MFSRPCLADVGQIVLTIVVTIAVTIVVAFVVAFLVPFVVVTIVAIVVPFVVPFAVEFVVAATGIRAHRKVIPWCSTAAPTDFGFQLNLELELKLWRKQ